MKFRKLLTAVLFVALVTGCGSKESDQSNEKPPGKEAESSSSEAVRLTPEQRHEIGLQVVEATEEEILPGITIAGHVRTRSGGEAEVFSPFSGRLMGETSLPQIGDLVTKGQHIADVEQQIAATDQFQVVTTGIQLKVSLQQAQQNLDQAQQEVSLRQTELNRSRQLYEGGAIPLKQVQTAEFELKQAETKLQAARRAVEEYATVPVAPNSSATRIPVVSPISGTVLSVGAAIGQQVDPARSILKIADLTTVWVEAAVPEHDLGRVRQARTAEVTIPEASTRPYAAKLVTVGSTVDSENRTVPILYAVENRDTFLKIEMFVQVRIPTGPPAKSLLIPASAVLSNQGSSIVYVETTTGVFNRRTVELGERIGPRVVVVEGVLKGEKVVSAGAQMLLSQSRKEEIPVEAEEEENKRK